MGFLWLCKRFVTFGARSRGTLAPGGPPCISPPGITWQGRGGQHTGEFFWRLRRSLAADAVRLHSHVRMHLVLQHFGLTAGHSGQVCRCCRLAFVLGSYADYDAEAIRRPGPVLQNLHTFAQRRGFCHVFCHVLPWPCPGAWEQGGVFSIDGKPPADEACYSTIGCPAPICTPVLQDGSVDSVCGERDQDVVIPPTDSAGLSQAQQVGLRSMSSFDRCYAGLERSPHCKPLRAPPQQPGRPTDRKGGKRKRGGFSGGNRAWQVPDR